VVVSKVVTNPTKGKEWNPRMAAQKAEATLRHTEIVHNVQIGWGGLGLGPGKPVCCRAGPKEKIKLVVEQVRRQEEMLRGTKAVAQGLDWEGVEKKKLSWKELWSMEDRSIRFLIGATYDVLPTPQNLKLWVNGDLLCSGTATLRHILSGCKVS